MKFYVIGLVFLLAACAPQETCGGEQAYKCRDALSGTGMTVIEFRELYDACYPIERGRGERYNGYFEGATSCYATRLDVDLDTVKDCFLTSEYQYPSRVIEESIKVIRCTQEVTE